MKNTLLNKTIAAMLCILMLFSSIPVYAEDSISKPNHGVTDEITEDEELIIAEEESQELIATPDTVSLHLKDSKEYSRFIIKYKNKKSIGSEKEVAEVFKDNLKSFRRLNNFDVVTIKNKTKARELLSQLKNKKADSNIEYIQPDYRINISSSDTNYSMQWGIHNEEVITVGDSYYHIDANVVPAWEISHGAGVTVAVIDTGIDITHEDLENSIWQNTNEVPDNGVDDDENGFIDDVFGWNFVDENKFVHDSEAAEDELHGTSMAGVIAAEKDNDKGIAGVAPAAKIMPIKAFADGYAYTSDIIQAIDYADIMGTKIVNCSWESDAPNPEGEGVG